VLSLCFPVVNVLGLTWDLDGGGDQDEQEEEKEDEENE
jgi:hypothetical protein